MASFQQSSQAIYQASNRAIFQARAHAEMSQFDRHGAFAAQEMAEPEVLGAPIDRFEDDVELHAGRQWFDNFLLDQTVTQAGLEKSDLQVTAWTKAADLWATAHPNRLEEAPAAEYIKDHDY